MSNEILRKIESNKTLRDLSAVFRGLLAVAILFIVIALDGIVIDKHDELGIPHVPIIVLIIDTAIVLFSFFLGIGFLYHVYYINKEDEEVKKNKALSVFLSAIFLSLGIIFTVSSVAIGISLYSKSIVEIALILVNLLSLFAIGRLLDDKEV